MTLKKLFPVPALQSRAPGLFFALLSLSVPARPADLDALTVPLPPGGAALRLSVFTGPDKTTQASCDCLFHPGDRVEAVVVRSGQDPVVVNLDIAEANQFPAPFHPPADANR